jgi:hypothetical protein
MFLSIMLLRRWNAPLPLYKVESAASVAGLSPVTFSAPVHSTSELLRFL